MHKGKKPKGMVIMIAVGGGKPPSHGHSPKDREEGCEMIKIPLAALAADSEEGDGVSPEVGDAVVLENVEGELVGVDGDAAHIELKTANGQPIEYVEHEAKAEEEDLEVEEDMLRAMATDEDEKSGY